MPEGFAAAYSSALAKRRGRSAKQPRSLEDLREEVATLEAEQAAYGASGIEQESPGVFRRILDVLSRPNYAIAGFAEEVATEQPSVARGVKRALTEIFSGIGGLEGQKRAFGEVLELQGVPTHTLADAFPALEGTWVGNLGSRGAAGLALDIATDPLTYMTFGASTGARIATSKGIRYLNKSGLERFGEIMRSKVDEARRLNPDDAVGKTRAFTQAKAAAEQEFERTFAGSSGDIASELLEPGGAKLFGAQIPGTDKIGGAVGAVLDMLPESIAKPVVEGAQQMHGGMMRALRGMFSPEGALANLPQPIRDRAVRITNDFFRSSTAHRTHLMGQMVPMERVYRRLEKADPTIGQRWYDIREGVRDISEITNPEELAAFQATMRLYDQMGETLLEHGVLDRQDILPGYIYHRYKNPEALAQWHPRSLTKRPGGEPKFTKERAFGSFREAEEESKRLHELSLSLLSRGEAKRLYPILEPEYDVFKNMRSYIGAHADATARKAWREELIAQFGKQADELMDLDALYDDAARRIEPSAKPGAPQDFTPENVPLRRVIQEGDVERTLADKFGPDGAQYVAVKSKITGDELVYLPRAIAESLEQVRSSLFRTEDYKDFGKLLKGYDWINNQFKWANYVIWPASAVRDAYNNVANSMLRIGVAALDPKRHVDAVAIMAGRDLGEQFVSSGYTRGQLRELSKTFGVWVPGQVFVEQTGRLNLGPVRRALTEFRAGVENEARVLLWLEEIRRGADPRTAADTVGQFLFNYGELSRVERDLFRRLIPFYTFTRKNVELQAKMLRRNPGMSVNQLKPFRGRESENEQMMQWEAEGLKMRLDRDGKTVHMVTGIDLPLRNLDTLWRGDLGRTGRGIMGMLTPVIKTWPEVLLDRDFFLGRSLTRTQSDSVGRFLDVVPTPQGLKDWIGYRKEVDEAGRPRYTFDGRRFQMVLRSWITSRAISTSDRQFREYTQNGGYQFQKMAWDVLTGLRVKSVDMDEQMRRRMEQRIRELEDSLARRGVMQEYEKRYRPRDTGRVVEYR